MMFALLLENRDLLKTLKQDQVLTIDPTVKVSMTGVMFTPVN
jgi:hypothetical protein